jgi:hypothetical protein
MISPKLVEILISVRFYRRGDKLFQHFQYGKQRNTKYILDPRYLMKQLFNEKVIEYSLARNSDYEYLEKRDEEGEVILVYEAEKTIIPSSFYFKVVDFIPPNPGCEFCQFKKIIDEKTICLFQNNKVIEKELKTCKLFRQKRIFKS